jgi:RNA recognition motif-containing protein
MVKKSVSQKIGEKTLALRRNLWPEITDDILWHRKRKTGYTTIPRAMAYIIQIMNSLSTGKPLGQAYLTLWCHTYDEYMVTIANPRLMAFESGFTGQRAEATWNGRMKALVELGFIDAKPGASGLYNYVLIFNPYTAIKELKNQKEPIPINIYHALLQRMKDIGANDLI